MKRLLPFLALCIASCGEVKTGGFETSDLQARVHRKDGSPVASARVWLVRSNGDSAPGKAIDSSWTDNEGMVRFPTPREGTEHLGLDVLREDSLGLSPRAFDSSNSTSVLVAVGHKLTFLGDSAGIPKCFVPGSHFASRPGSDPTSSEFVLPQGTWSLAVARGSSTPVIKPFVVAKDSIVTMAALHLDSAPAPASLAEGPNIALDSFRIGSQRYLRDTAYPSTWSVQVDTFSGSARQRTHGYPVVFDTIHLESRSLRFVDAIDSMDGLLGTQARSVKLPDTGLLAISLGYYLPYDQDSGRNLAIRFTDSSYNGAALNLDARMRFYPDSSKITGWGIFADSLQGGLTPSQKLQSVHMYFRWTPSIVEISNDGGVVGIAKASRRMDGPPTLLLILRSFLHGPASRVDVVSSRLYRPR